MATENAEMTALEPRRAPSSYYVEHRKIALSNLNKFCNLGRLEREELFNNQSREAARQLASTDAAEIARGVAAIERLTAWRWIDGTLPQ